MGDPAGHPGLIEALTPDREDRRRRLGRNLIDVALLREQPSQRVSGLVVAGVGSGTKLIDAAQPDEQLAQPCGAVIVVCRRYSVTV